MENAKSRDPGLAEYVTKRVILVSPLYQLSKSAPPSKHQEIKVQTAKLAVIITLSATDCRAHNTARVI